MKTTQVVAIFDNIGNGDVTDILYGAKLLGTFDSNPEYQVVCSKGVIKDRFYITEGTRSYQFKVYEVSSSVYGDLKKHYNVIGSDPMKPSGYIVLKDSPYAEGTAHFKFTESGLNHANITKIEVKTSILEDFISMPF